MDDKLEDLKNKFEEKKKRLREKEKELINQEKKVIKQKYSEIGKLAYKAEIASLNIDVLLGAFLEISERSKSEKEMAKWKEKTNHFYENLKTSPGTRLSIKFTSAPEKEIAQNLKEMKFKWNTFRGEYYGIGDKQSLEKILSSVPCSIEVIS